MIRPSNLQTIITKNAGFAVPDGLFEAILQHKPTAFGFVVQTKDDGLAIEREDGEGLTLDQLKEFNHNAFDHPAMIYFGELTKGYNVEDIQPFILHDGDDKPFLAVGIEGDFPKFSEGNGRTDESNLVSKIIIPTLLDICQDMDGDLAKIIAKLGKPLFNDQFISHIGHRGVLTIIPHEGEIITLGKNEIGEVYDWGTTSQKHGYGDAVQEPAPEPVKEEVKPKNKFWSKTVSGGGAKPAPDKGTTDANGIHTVKDAATPGSAPRVSVPEVKAEKITVFRPPNWVHKNEDKKAWYTLVCGGPLPSNWKKGIPVEAKIPVLPKSLEEMRAMQAEKLKEELKSVKANPTSTAALPAPKSGAEVKAARTDIGKAEDNLPIMDAKETERALDFVAKHLDGQSNTMPNPLEIQKAESKWPTLSDTLGIKPHEMLNWPVSGLFALVKDNPKAVVLGLIEMRALWRATLKAEDLVNTATTVTKSGDSTVKTESVASPAPKSNKFWGGSKKVA